jgi:hypothetical protein
LIGIFNIRTKLSIRIFLNKNLGLIVVNQSKKPSLTSCDFPSDQTIDSEWVLGASFRCLKPFGSDHL